MAKTDLWAAGEAYEPYVGRWSRRVAPQFIAGLGMAPNKRWLDVGCGTGALSATILAQCSPASIVGIDPSEGFLAHARKTITDPAAEFRVGDAQAIPVGDRTVDAAVSGLVINFVSDKDRAVREMARATVPGGCVAAYVWDYAGEMQMMRRFWDAAAALDPAALEKTEGSRFPICREQPLLDLFRSAGLERVAVRAIDTPTVFRNFDDYWAPFLAGGAPAPAYCMALPEPRRKALRERLRTTLPTRPDGSIALIARAWAVQGTVPK